MASNIFSRLSTALNSLGTQFQHQSRTTILAATVIAISLGFLPRAYRDYKVFLSYGPGGVPYNLFGWLFTSLFLGPMRRETLSTDVYDDSGDAWLDGLARREGARPVIGPHVVPQRQLDQIPEREIQAKLVAAFEALCHANPHVLKLSPSKLEKHTEALFLADNVPSSAISAGLKGEISHIHGTSDHSVHVTLSPADCKTVIETGWGQRHPLDGSKTLRLLTGLWLPNQYILIYAPRNEEEIEIVLRIVKASAAYMSGMEVQ